MIAGVPDHHRIIIQLRCGMHCDANAHDIQLLLLTPAATCTCLSAPINFDRVRSPVLFSHALALRDFALFIRPMGFY